MSRSPPTLRFDSTLALKRNGYAFLSQDCDRARTDAFRTRLMLRRVYCLRGPEVARFFYDNAQPLTRRGSLPASVLHLLQDVGSVQTLDGADHEHRKRLFLAMMSPAAMDRIKCLFSTAWRESVPRWQRQGRIVLLDEMHEMLTGVAAEWAGLPLTPSIRSKRARELAAMIENAGAIGPRNWQARRLRRRTESWAEREITAIRRGTTFAAPETAAAAIADFRDRQGKPLPLDLSAVELLNVLRPIVAVARFIVFAALALHEHAGWRRRFAAGEDKDLEIFALEVRRFYPFFPAVGGKLTASVEVCGYHLPKGALLLFDLYGTNHDRRLWPSPLEFRPERFRGWQDDQQSFVPQGGGNVAHSHRCPGEALTMTIVMAAIRAMTKLSYEIPVQDLSVRLDRMPAKPASGFVLDLRG